MATDIDTLKKKIEDLDADIRRTEQRKSLSEGRLEAVKAQLKKEFGVETLEDAQKLIREKEKGIEDLEATRTELEQELKKTLDSIQQGK